MNNKTRIRLHLSKNLFESLSREILAEAKVNGGGAYTEAVKMPKVKKDPEVKATDKMKTMEEGPKEKAKHDVESLKKAKAKLEQRISEMETMTAEDKIEESKKSKRPTLNELRKKK